MHAPPRKNLNKILIIAKDRLRQRQTWMLKNAQRITHIGFAQEP